MEPTKNAYPEPRSRTLAAILDDLRKPVQPRHVKTKKQGGATISYVPHYVIRDYLDLYAPGWEWDFEMTVGHERLFCVGRLTVHGSDGSVTRAASGTEELSKSGYGDPSSNSESMCLRRAAMALGFCRDLWRK